MRFYCLHVCLSYCFPLHISNRNKNTTLLLPIHLLSGKDRKSRWEDDKKRLMMTWWWRCIHTKGCSDYRQEKRQVKDQDIKVNTKGMPMSADHGVTYDGSDNCVTIPKLNTRVSLSHAFARFTNWVWQFETTSSQVFRLSLCWRAVTLSKCL